MTDEEKKWMLSLLEAVEALFAENAALKVTLEHHHIAAKVYERECRELLEHPDHAHLVRARFADLRAYIEQTPDLSKAVKSLLRAFPGQNKPS